MDFDLYFTLSARKYTPIPHPTYVQPWRILIEEHFFLSEEFSTPTIIFTRVSYSRAEYVALKMSTIYSIPNKCEE